MTEHTYETEEMEAPAFLADPKVLTYLAGTDADLSRLVLEEDGMLWAYSKRNPSALFRCSLLDLVAVAFPAYATAPAPQPVAPAPPCYVEPPAPKPKAKAKQAETPVAIPKTGEAKGLLASSKGGGDRRPWIIVNGERMRCPKPTVDGSSIKVAVVTEGTLTGFAVLDRAAYNRMNTNPNRPDTLMFNMLGGEVTTRMRPGLTAPYPTPLGPLLVSLGSEVLVILEARA